MKLFKGEIQYRKKQYHQGFSILITILLFIGILSFAGSAENNNKDRAVEAFDMPLTEVVVSQGTNLEDIPLPKTLKVTLKEGGMKHIPVTWDDSELYDKNILGTYVFTADIGGYIYGQARPVALVSVALPGEASPSDYIPSDAVNSISGRIWKDENSDGIMEEGENGVAGYPVSLYMADNMGEAVLTTQTGDDGSYEFENLEPGNYIVSLKPEIVEGIGYKLPFVGMTGDNRFKLIESEDLALEAQSEVFEFSGTEDHAVEMVNAGVFGTVETRASVRNAGNFAQLKSSLRQSAPGDIIQITANINFSESLDITKPITFRSSAGNKFTLVQRTERHFNVDFEDYEFESAVTFENIILEGGSTGGGIEIEIGNYVKLNLNNSEIRNCNAAVGGAIGFGDRNTTNGGILTINGGRFVQNQAGSGGAIIVGRCKLTIRGSEFLNNSSTGDGGALGANVDSDVYLEGIEVVGNRTIAGFGGGLALLDCKATIVNSNFSSNRGMIEDDDGYGVGGGIYVFVASLKVKDSEFTNNRGSVGGGIVTYDSELLVENTDFVNNSSSMYGGAIAVYQMMGGGEMHKVQLHIHGGKIIGNASEKDGGGIYATNIFSQKYPIRIEGCDISNNEAAVDGGAIRAEGSELNLINTYLSSNTAKYGGGVFTLAMTDLILNGGGILNNTARSAIHTYPGGIGGGVHAIEGSTVVLENGALISENTAEFSINSSGLGGGVSLIDSHLTVRDGDITDNTSNQMGGGIYGNERAGVTLYSGEISGNKSPNGGGIYMEALRNLSVTSPSVVFRDNLAATANEKEDVDMVLHDQMIHTTHFTAPFDFAYSNYDVGYTKTSTGGVFYTVTFNSQGGDPVSSMLVEAGTTITAPSPEPTKTGYTFGGWYKEQECENPWNFVSDTVLSDMTLYAKWEQKIDLTVSKTVKGDYGNKTKDFTFTIYFMDNNGFKLPAGTQFPYTGGVISGVEAEVPADNVLILDQDGKAVFSLKHGQQIRISDIASNTKVQVVETDFEGYIVSFHDGNHTGSGADTGIYTLGEPGEFSFINTRQDVVPAGVLTGNVKGSVLFIVSVLVIAAFAGGVHLYRRQKRRV